MIGILVHGDNHFIVDGPRPDSATWRPSAADLAAYTGTYYSSDAETTLEISVVNDQVATSASGLPLASAAALIWAV